MMESIDNAFHFSWFALWIVFTRILGAGLDSPPSELASSQASKHASTKRGLIPFY